MPRPFIKPCISHETTPVPERCVHRYRTGVAMLPGRGPLSSQKVASAFSRASLLQVSGAMWPAAAAAGGAGEEGEPGARSRDDRSRSRGGVAS